MAEMEQPRQVWVTGFKEDGEEMRGIASLDSYVFAAPIRPDIIHQVVVWQLAKRRQGTAHAKTISLVRGTTRKPWRQKGTGRARHGSRRSNLWRTGGRKFGPVLRDFAYTLPKKIRRFGLRSALSTKYAQGKLFVVEPESIDLDEPKTCVVHSILTRHGWTSLLLVTGPEIPRNLARGAANLRAIDILPQQGCNVYDIMSRDVLLLTRDAVRYLEFKLGRDYKPSDTWDNVILSKKEAEEKVDEGEGVKEAGEKVDEGEGVKEEEEKEPKPEPEPEEERAAEPRPRGRIARILDVWKKGMKAR